MAKRKATWMKPAPKVEIPEEYREQRKSINQSIGIVSSTLEEPLRDTYNRIYDEFEKVTGIDLKTLQEQAKQEGRSAKKIDVIQDAGKLDVLDDITGQFVFEAVK